MRASGRKSAWETATLALTGGAGLDSLEIRETGADDGWGAVIDNFQIIPTHTDFFC